MNNVSPTIVTASENVYPKNIKFRVLVISHTYVVGINQSKLDLIAATDDVEVGLLVPEKWEAVQWNKRLQLECPYPNIKVYPSRVWFEGRSGAYLYPVLDMLAAILDFRPDVLQIEEELFSLSSFEAALFAKIFNKPMVLFVWENMDRQLSSIRTWFRNFVLDTTQCIIAGNHEGANLVKQWGYRKKVEIIPQMGVDTEQFSPRLKRVNTEFCIGYVGRISHHKGIDTLVKAGSILLEQGYQFNLVFCGSGTDDDKFKQQVKEEHLDDYVTWRGGVRHDEVPEEMGKFDVLVLPSRTVETWKEQFGHVLIEAMAMGIPTVGSTCGEIPNVIGRPDLIFEEGNPQELAAILAHFISDSKWNSEMQQYSLDRVATHFSNERVAEQSIALWRDVMRQYPNTSQS